MPHRKARSSAVIGFVASALALPFVATASSLASTPSAITIAPFALTPGVPWADDSGNLIQGHNGSVIAATSTTGVTTYYWIGQDLETSPNQQAFACYSSTDLMHWAYLGDAVKPGTQVGWSSGYEIDTPKVLYNGSEYVLWASVRTGKSGSRTSANFQIDVATSSQPCGPYTWVGQNNNPLPFQPQGNPSGDIGVFADNNGSAYLLSEDQGTSSADTNRGLYIYALTTDFTAVVSAANGGVIEHFAPNQDYEAPAMFRSGNTYYVFASPKNGRVPIDNLYTDVAANSSGSLSPNAPWQEPWNVLVPTPQNGTDPLTCVSQTMDVLRVNGDAGGTSYIYLGDRWDKAHLNDSSYVWLPVKFTNAGPTLDCSVSDWSINTDTAASDALKGLAFTFTNADFPVPEVLDQALDVSSPGGLAVQQWEITVVNEPGETTTTPYYTIENVSSGEVLQAASTGSELSMATASSTDKAQQWEFESAPAPSGQGVGLMLVNRQTTNVLNEQATGDVDQEPLSSATYPLWGLSEVPGYWAVTNVGNVQNAAGTPWFGSLASGPPVTDVVGFVPTPAPDGGGYWMIESHGKVTAFGDAVNYSGVTQISPPANCLLVGAIANPGPTGGFWAFDNCGDVDPEGGAPTYSSTVPAGVTTIVGMAAAQGGVGFWQVDQKGTVYPGGTAGAVSLGNACDVASVATDPAGGFWALTKCGAVLGAAGAVSLGGEHNLGNTDFTKMAVTADGGGYWLFEQSAGSNPTVYRFGDATDGTQPDVSSTNTLTAAVGDPSM